MNIEVNDRTEICKFTCALKNMSWADRSQDFAWTFEETEDNDATPCPPDTLTKQVYIQEELTRGRKSTKSLHKQQSLVEKGQKPGEPISLPKKLTIHVILIITPY